MPGRDNTGPLGRGPMTGRGMGYCANPSRSGGYSRYGGRFGGRMGNGYGYGYGLGFRNRFRAYPYMADAPASKTDLEAEKTELQERLNEIEELIKKA